MQRYKQNNDEWNCFKIVRVVSGSRQSYHTTKVIFQMNKDKRQFALELSLYLYSLEPALGNTPP